MWCRGGDGVGGVCALICACHAPVEWLCTGLWPRLPCGVVPADPGAGPGDGGTLTEVLGDVRLEDARLGVKAAWRIIAAETTCGGGAPNADAVRRPLTWVCCGGVCAQLLGVGGAVWETLLPVPCEDDSLGVSVGTDATFDKAAGDGFGADRGSDITDCCDPGTANDTCGKPAGTAVGSKPVAIAACCAACCICSSR